ncbi:ABC transporter substrate-binding protein [Amycolatopsis sp. GM8]|uniref:ABC transporter substrate-binding protein n=1 Tax=Amycolatopsis sp. GM8 TaxID=2896530 RepID=UPI001F282B6B|nr:ABC transporter substrate-binding protein [Amycolatopsis sp. GM8]
MIPRTRRWTVTAVAVVASAGLLSGCSGAAVGGSTGGSASGIIDTGNCPQGFDTMGITDDTVKIGQSAAFSGSAASPIPLGFAAYVAMKNSEGGFEFGDGKRRKVELTALDDGYEPARARSNVDKLVNGDKVFAIASMYGTPTNLAAREVNAEACTPNVYSNTSNDELGNPAYPWTLAPVGPPSSEDAMASVKFIVGKNPNAKIAVLYQNDDFGKLLLAAFKDQLKTTGATLAAEQTFSPSDSAVSAQITTIAGSGATDFVMFAGAGTYQLQALESIAQSNWKPETKYLTGFQSSYLDQLSPAAAQNVFFSIWAKNPNDPDAVARDQGLQTFLEWYKKQPGAAALNPAFGTYGWTSGQLLDLTFKAMKTPTRTALIDATRHLTYTGPSLMHEGITWSMDWPHNPYGMVKEYVMGYDPGGAAGRKFKEMTLIDLTGQITYRKYS